MSLVKGFMQTRLSTMTVEDWKEPYNLNEPMQMWERLFAVTVDGVVYETTVDTTKQSNPHFDTKGRIWIVSELTSEQASKFEFIGNYQMPKIIK